MNKKSIKIGVIVIILFLLIVVSLSFFVFGSFINQFNNALTIENLSFTGNQNITRFIDLPLYSNVTDAYINLSGIFNYKGVSIKNVVPNGALFTITTTNYQPANNNATASITISDTYINKSENVTLIVPICKCDGWYPYGYANTMNLNFWVNEKLVDVITPDKLVWCNVTHVGSCQGSVTDWVPLSFNTSNLNLTGIANNFKLQGAYTGAESIYTYVQWNGIGVPTTRAANISYNGSSSFVGNVSLDVRNDTIYEFIQNGIFWFSNNKTDNLRSPFNVALNNGSCNCSGCSISGINCSVPIIFHSDTAGIMQVSDINIQYDPIPIVNLSSPANNSWSSAKYNLTCNSTDEIQLSNITIYLWNATNNAQFNKTTYNITGTSNSTIFQIDFNRTENFKWNCLAYNNASYWNWADDNRTIKVDIDNPIINLNYPSNNSYLNNGTYIELNYTPQHFTQNIDACELYGDWNGIWHKNLTNSTSIIKGSVNTFKQNLTEGNYNWTVWCNLTITSSSSFSQDGNYTFTIDTTLPQINITTSNGTSFSGLATTINFNITDRNVDSCFFTLRDSSGNVHNYAENTSVSCSATSRAISVLAYGTYTFRLWGRDLADNENSSSLTFISTAPSVPPSGGGGGEKPQLISVVALRIPEELRTLAVATTYSELMRAILYKEILQVCGKKCILTNEKKVELQNILKQEGVEITLSDLDLFIKQFQENAIENVQVSKEDVNRYGLVTAIVEVIGAVFDVESLDRFWIVIGNKISYSLRSTKVLKECQVQESQLQWSCQVSNYTYTLSYDNLNPPDFLFRTFTNTVIFIDTDNEQKLKNVTIRAVTPIGLIIMVLTGGVLIFSFSYGIKIGKRKGWFKKVRFIK